MTGNKRGMLSDGDIEGRLAELFTSLGYSFTKDGILNGRSGYRHRFDFLLQKGNQTVCLDFASDARSLIASLAKSVDIRGVNIVIAVRKHETLMELLLAARKAELSTSQPRMGGGEPTILVYESADELLGKLELLLGQL